MHVTDACNAPVFLTLSDINKHDYSRLFECAFALKANRLLKQEALAKKTLAMIFEKPSTRTRVSFEVGIRQLGGNGLFLSSNDLQLSRGEPIAHTARVLSSMVDMIMLRCMSHTDLVELATHASVPVINGLSDYAHPCQLLADLMTIQECGHNISTARMAWIGNAQDNMCNSFIEASHLFGFALAIGCPSALAPSADILNKWGSNVTVFHAPAQAVADASVVVTDVWQSMGNVVAEDTLAELAHFQVNTELMEKTNNAIFMHCLPMRVGEEVSSEVVSSPAAQVWKEAENRLHAQKALMLYLSEAI